MDHDGTNDKEDDARKGTMHVTATTTFTLPVVPGSGAYLNLTLSLSLVLFVDFFSIVLYFTGIYLVPVTVVAVHHAHFTRNTFYMVGARWCKVQPFQKPFTSG